MLQCFDPQVLLVACWNAKFHSLAKSVTSSWWGHYHIRLQRLEDQKVKTKTQEPHRGPRTPRHWLPALILLKDMEEIFCGRCRIIDSAAFHVEVHAFEWRSSVWYFQIDLTLRDFKKILTQKKGRINMFDICFFQIWHFSGWCFMLHLKLHIDLLVSAAAFCRSSPWKLVLKHVASCHLELWRRLGVAEIWNHVSKFTITYYCMWLCILIYIYIYLCVCIYIYVTWQMDDIRCIHESAGGSDKKKDPVPFGVLPKGWWPFLFPVFFWRIHAWQLRITACDSQRQVESSYRFSRQLDQARCGDGIALLWILWLQLHSGKGAYATARISLFRENSFGKW